MERKIWVIREFENRVGVERGAKVVGIYFMEKKSIFKLKTKTKNKNRKW